MAYVSSRIIFQGSSNRSDAHFFVPPSRLVLPFSTFLGDFRRCSIHSSLVSCLTQDCSLSTEKKFWHKIFWSYHLALFFKVFTALLQLRQRTGRPQNIHLIVPPEMCPQGCPNASWNRLFLLRRIAERKLEFVKLGMFSSWLPSLPVSGMALRAALLQHVNQVKLG